ncbi:MAG: 16S rRNA (guanine(527)-N(7))-methyltransferase RsmG [Pseudomonadales bacterium]|nr:16S rRNA (guanine(527)-N(7))-methyltransferase RsmG [Pseudomonadales bacterium]
MAGRAEPPGGIVAAAARLGVALDAHQAEQLESFVDLLGRWNARFNLLSRQDMERIWSRHVLDSLSLLPLLPPPPRSRVLDVGSGAGLPGLPLAVASPERTFLLVDRNQRKTRFLELAVHTLGLVNVRCVCGDVAGLSGEERFDVIVSRAVAQPAQLWAWCGHLLAEGGRLVLMTGAGGHPAREAAEPDPSGQPEARSAIPLTGAHIEARCEIEIPGLDRPHEVTIIRAGEIAQTTGRPECRMS